MVNIPARIKSLRERLELSQEEFARKLDVTQATVSRWEKGAKPEYENLAALAKLDGVSADEFTGRTAPGQPTLAEIEIVGAVQAGAWSDAIEWPQNRRYQINWKPSERYNGVRKFGLEVQGTSMDLIYPPGSTLICVKLMDVERAPLSGERVIVYQIRGDEIEATAKEYVVDANGQTWLWPRSRDPLHQTPLPYPTPGSGVDEIVIHAIVIGSYRPE